MIRDDSKAVLHNPGKARYLYRCHLALAGVCLTEPRLLNPRVSLPKSRPTLPGRRSFAKVFIAKCCCLTFRESFLSRKLLVIRYDPVKSPKLYTNKSEEI